MTGPGLAYATSAVVYDRADGILVAEDADGHPINHCGVHKQANEGAARVYWRDDAVASIGLRPHVVYGPGRDHGMTAGPTLAMVAAVRDERYQIPFGGRAQFQYAPEAAGAITFKEDVLLPLPEDMAAERPVSTPLAAGVRETIEVLQRAQHSEAAGRVAP